MAIRLGSGFKVNSITIYPGYGQLNGEFVREPGEVDAASSNSQSFTISLNEANQIASEMQEGIAVFDLALARQVVDPLPLGSTQPDTTPRGATAPDIDRGKKFA